MKPKVLFHNTLQAIAVMRLPNFAGNTKSYSYVWEIETGDPGVADKGVNKAF